MTLSPKTATSTDILLFSDFHAHNFRYGAKREQHPDPVVEAQFNSRLIDCVRVLREIEQYALQEGIKTLVFGGDLFHKRQTIYTDVFYIIFREFARMSENLDIIMIPGNHDYSDRHGHVHSLKMFDSLPGVYLRDKPVNVDEFEGVNIVTVPYTDDIDKAKAVLKEAGEIAEARVKPSILVAHLGMQGAKVGSDYVLISEADVEVSDVPQDSFTACFFGHYHQHQKLFPNGFFVGATHHHNWGDANHSRGFVHLRVDGSNYSFRHVETTVAPRFVNLKRGEEDQYALRPNDFVRYHYSSDDSPLQDELDALSERLGVTHLEPIEHASREEEALVLPTNRLEPTDLIDAWVEHHVEEGLREEMAELGKLLLREAKEQML